MWLVQSDLSLQGGDVGGLNVAEGTVSVGEILKLKDSGQITGSQVLFTGGKIAAFNLSDDAFSTDSFSSVLLLLIMICLYQVLISMSRQVVI